MGVKAGQQQLRKSGQWNIWKAAADQLLWLESFGWGGGCLLNEDQKSRSGDLSHALA